MQQYPGIPWVSGEQVGNDWFRAQCSACGAAAQGSEAVVHQFAAAHTDHPSEAPRFYGMGDAIAAAAGALGIEHCAPCEERRVTANRLMPRVWWR